MKPLSRLRKLEKLLQVDDNELLEVVVPTEFVAMANRITAYGCVHDDKPVAPVVYFMKRSDLRKPLSPEIMGLVERILSYGKGGSAS
jgi:hypothetical protein